VFPPAACGYANVRRNVANPHTVVSNIRNDVANTQTIIPNIRHGVANTHTLVSDIRCDTLQSQEGINGQHRRVSTTHIHQQHDIHNSLDSTQVTPPLTCFGCDKLTEKIVGHAENVTPIARSTSEVESQLGDKQRKGY
jgi:hypothetical protein